MNHVNADRRREKTNASFIYKAAVDLSAVDRSQATDDADTYDVLLLVSSMSSRKK